MSLSQSERSRKWRATPKGKYAEHKRRARYYQIGFFLTFDEWWSIWQDSGRWEQRGNRKWNYVMARHNDEGAYTCGNVSIQTYSDNVRTRNRTVWRKPEHDAPIPF